MERKRWSRYLEDPSRLVQEESDPVRSIEELLQRSPYCQPLYLLQCKALKDSDRIDWKEKARERAVLVPDRKRLFQLLQEEVSGASGSKAPSEKSGEEDPPTPHQESHPTQSEEREEEEASEVDQIDPTPLEQEILSEAVQTRILYDAEDALIEEDRTEGPPEGENEEKEGSEQSSEKESPQKMSFTAWLDPHPTEKEQREERSDQELMKAFIEEGNETPKKGQQEERAFFSSERMAEKSSDESAIPVSETLADLYVQQGDLKRAIEAFEKLRLKVPEKSDYFAGRVQELKERKK